MGVRRKVFYPVAFTAMLFASSAMAKINPTAFVGVSKFFLKDKSKNIDMGFYDPTLGEVALESGLIENIRFFGAFKAEAERKDDTSKDPLWNMTNILFPSINNQLGTVTGADTNFGKYVKNPKVVALLLNYAKKVEDVKGKGNLPGTVTQQFSADILKTLEGIGAGRSTIDNFKKVTLNPLLNAIRESIESEKKGTSLYPRHTTEQVISAFFCYQFNKQDDIWNLIRELKELDPSIIDTTKSIPTQNHYLEEKDLPKIAEKVEKGKEEVDFDDLFDLTQAYIFSSPTPYKSGINLLNNGTTNFYDRAHPTDPQVQGTFQDCVETSMRHICNLLLFDPLAREFNLKSIEGFVENQQGTGVKNPYFGNFKAFYDQQKLLMANAGDIGTRSLWNTVVGNLPKTTYRRDNGNEIKSGFINLLSTFDTIFTLGLKEAPTTGFDTKKAWIEESLKTLFSALNPTYTYTIDLKASDFENDLVGDAFITVKNTEKNENLFTFNLQRKVAHMEVNQLKVLMKQDSADYTEGIEKHLPLLQKRTTEESLLLLASPHLQRDIHPFYKLYSKPLFDNTSKIEFLKELGDNYEAWKTHPSFKGNISSLQSMAKNVVNSVGWEDEYVRKNIGPALFSMAKSEDFQDSLEKVRYLLLDKASLENLNQRIQNFKGLEVLDVTNNSYFQGAFPLTDKFKNIKRLILTFTRTTKLTGLENTPNLEELNLSRAWKCSEVELPNSLPHIKKMNFIGAGVRSLTGLKNMPILEELSIDETNYLSNISFTGRLENLKSISAVASKLSTLTGLENLPGLEELNLAMTSNLSTVAFPEKIESLTALYLDDSGISELTGLDNLENLKELNLSRAKNLTSLKFEKDNKDLVLKLGGSGIKKLEDIEGYQHLSPRKVSFEDRGSWL